MYQKFVNEITLVYCLIRISHHNLSESLSAALLSMLKVNDTVHWSAELFSYRKGRGNYGNKAVYTMGFN